MTIVKGRFLKPDGTAMAGVTVQAYLEETAGESSGPEIYASNESISATSDASGNWQMNLWANSNGVLPTKYTFIITYKVNATPVKYSLAVPNVTEINFSDLMINYTQDARATELLNTEAALYDFTITQGNSVRKKFELLDSSNQTTDLSGWTGKLYIDTNGTVIAHTLVVDSTSGTLQLNLTKVQTKTMTGSLPYELVIENTEDSIKLLYGTITVTPSLFTQAV